MSARFLVVVGVAVLGAVGIGWAVGTLRKTHSPSPVAATQSRGSVLFQVHCAACHGPEGRGDGPSAAALRPSPRDFAARPWRFAVTKDSIRGLILDGIPGTAMAASRAALAAADVEPLVEFVYDLAVSRPLVERPASSEDLLMRDLGFTDLRGLAPPPLVVHDATSREVRLTDMKGKLVLVHFWGLACTHCLAEIPAMRELEASLAEQGLVVLHVCTDAEDAKTAQERLEQAVTGLRALVDEGGLGLARYEVQTLPTVWFMAPDGTALARSQGVKDWRSPALRALVASWLPVRAPTSRARSHLQSRDR